MGCAGSTDHPCTAALPHTACLHMPVKLVLPDKSCFAVVCHTWAMGRRKGQRLSSPSSLTAARLGWSAQPRSRLGHGVQMET